MNGKNINDYSRVIQQLQGQRNLYIKSLEEAKREEPKSQMRYELLLKLRALLQEVGQKTQQNLEFHISSMVTTALRAVNSQFPEFKMRFVIRRNQTECDLLFVDNWGNEREEIVNSEGGGVLDITSFALRIAFWSIRKNAPIMILDEPFRNLSPDLHEKAGQMLKMISDKLKLQFIVVSHSETVNEAADKTFFVERKNGISTVREI